MAKHSVGLGRHAVARGASSTGTGGKMSTAKPRVSDRLEEDAQAMEDRLIQLRLKMLEDKQRLEKELPTKFSGSRWRSAQEGIGSVSRYAKDVEQRAAKPKGTKNKEAKQTSEEDAGDAKPNKLKKKTKTQALGHGDSGGVLIASAATVKKWTTSHVLQWLTSLGLDEFSSAFEFHQVTGVVLLAMQPHEFAQIGVDRLSARNLMWSELDCVKDAAQMAAQRGALAASEIIDPTIRDVALVPEAASPDKEGRRGSHGSGVHWSHVKPLHDASAAATGDRSEVPVNLADGEFDEDVGHASFMKALLDWRAGDDDADAKAQGGGGSDDGLWFNPLAASNNDEQAGTGGGEARAALLDGEYDEAKEQEAFRQAVMAWRRGDASQEAAVSRPPSAEVERIEQGCTPEQRKSCWQCYRVARADSLVRDATTDKAFCGPSCLAAFQHEYARLYATKDQ